MGERISASEALSKPGGATLRHRASGRNWNASHNDRSDSPPLRGGDQGAVRRLPPTPPEPGGEYLPSVLMDLRNLLQLFRDYFLREACVGQRLGSLLAIAEHPA